MEKKSVPLELILEAQEALKKSPLIHSPLLLLNLNVPGKRIYLKCENLQPFCSFKARGACFAISKMSEAQLNNGVCGASAGNFAQGLGYMAKQFGVPCEMLVPDYIPNNKLEKILELGVKVTKVPFGVWWEALLTKGYDGMGEASFIHPTDLNVMAGHGTIGLEILDDLPDVDTIICPYGSGGLITGISSAVKAKCPNVKVMACEPATAAPLIKSLACGRPIKLEDRKASFVDGMGGESVFESMWPYVSHLVDASVTLSLRQIADAVSLLADRNSIVAEGAGAATLAAALSDDVPGGNIVCVISGGNIDLMKLATIFHGDIPQ